MPSAIKRAEALRAERANLAEQAREILQREEEEDRELTADEKARVDRLHEEIEEKKETVDRLERQAEADESIESRRSEGPESGRPDPEGGDTRETDEELETRAFWNFIRYGMSELPEDQRQAVERRQQTLGNVPQEARALAAGTDSAGGFTVPTGFREELVEAEKRFGGMREVAEVITTEMGNDLPYPQVDDTGNKGAILSENTQVSEQDMTFTSTTLSAFMYTSKLIRVPLQLLQDSAFDLESWLPGKLGERIGRITNEHYTTGTGSSQPNGVVTASTKGADAQNAASYSYDDFVKLEAAVDPAYLDNARWMLSQTGIREAKLIKDGDGRPIWTPGMASREPDTILGYPYTVNQDMAAPASAAKSLLLGDFSLYKIRSVRDVQVMVLRERYADFLQVGFLAFARRDGDLIDAGNNPVQHLLHP